MFKSVRTKKLFIEQAEIQMTPLIDMVFILLIFFVVTTSFVSETGLNIQRPQSSSSETLPHDNLTIEIDAAGRITIDSQRVGLLSIRSFLQKRLRLEPKLAVVLAADKTISVDRVVSVMDEVRAAGINEVALATIEKN
ncbi:MAG: biopolymer transporter ExbD [Sedimentisphaerales bacterium]|nr:biopolymer transporter ExbD [Sedimentisphaerales bacterium]